MKLCFIGDIHGKVNTPNDYLLDYNEDLFNQLEWVKQYCEQNNIQNIFHLGDIFDKPEATDNWKNKFINQWKDFKGTFYSIIGAAHDLFYNKENSYDRTCLRNLELAGAIKVLNNTKIILDNVGITSVSPDIKIAKQQIKNLSLNCQYEIILAHQFYNWGFDKSAGFENEDFNNIQKSCNLILGHDHHQYKEVSIKNVTIFRPGSFMRTELSESTIKMKPRILIFDEDKFYYVEIPHRDINEIYNVAAYKLNKSKAFKEIKNNIKDISEYLNKDADILRCSDFLKEVNCPVEEFQYLKTLHQVQGQDF